MITDESVPVSGGGGADEVPGITARAADTGAGVLDLAAMRADLEAARRRG